MDVGSAAAQRQIVDVSTGHLVKQAATTFGAEQDCLVLPALDVLPAEEPGVDRPGARPDHRQCCPNRR